MGQEVAKAFLGDQPLAKWIVPPVGRMVGCAIEAVLDTAVRGDRSPESSAAIMKALFDPSDVAPPLARESFHSLPYGGDVSNIPPEIARLAQHVGRVLGSYARSAGDEVAPGAAAAAGSESPPAEDSIADVLKEPDDGSPLSAIFSLLRDPKLAEMWTQTPVADAMAQLGDADPFIDQDEEARP